jgi:hypothetical protein
MGRIRVDSCWPGQPRYAQSVLLRAIASCTHTAQALYLLSAPLARSVCRPARPLKNPAIPSVPRPLVIICVCYTSTASTAFLRSYSVHPRVGLVAPFGADSRHVRRTALSRIIWEVRGNFRPVPRQTFHMIRPDCYLSQASVPSNTYCTVQ